MGKKNYYKKSDGTKTVVQGGRIVGNLPSNRSTNPVSGEGLGTEIGEDTPTPASPDHAALLSLVRGHLGMDGNKLIALAKDPRTPIDTIHQIAVLDGEMWAYRIEYDGDGSTLFAGDVEVSKEVYRAILKRRDLDAETLTILARSENFRRLDRGDRDDVFRRVLTDPRTPPDAIQDLALSGVEYPLTRMSHLQDPRNPTMRERLLWWAVGNPNCPPEVIRQAPLKEAITHPNCPPDVVASAAVRGYPAEALAHPNCPPEVHSVLDRSAPSAEIDRLTMNENRDIAWQALNHPNVTINGILQAAKSEERWRRVAAAEAMKATPELLISLAEDPDEKVRQAAMNNNAMPREYLERMVKWGKGRHPDRNVRKEVKRILKQRDARAAYL